ncbi:hypothetical protein [Ancylobacter sp.]|uniref:hypothetical protein n=1 Tax=Ancylobacter sp. TaxID=1872567 RepID=UPI003C79E057
MNLDQAEPICLMDGVLYRGAAAAGEGGDLVDWQSAPTAMLHLAGDDRKSSALSLCEPTAQLFRQNA